MPQKKILLDTNAYFRLARSIRPLLFVEFGEDLFCLYVIDELEYEFKRNTRLKHKFHWIMEKEYVDNRKKPINISQKQKTSIEIAYTYIYAQSREIGVSSVDSKALATASVLDIRLVSDDGGVRQLATDMNIGIMNTLELMKLMLDNNHITMRQIKEIVAYWSYDRDLPSGKEKFSEEYEQLFGEEPPYEVFEE